MSCVYEFNDGATPTPNTIFEFLEMSPSPKKASNRQTYLVRTNVNGAAIYQDGFRGELFDLSTSVDAQDEAAGLGVIDAYKAAVGTIYNVIYNGEDYGPFLVHDVDPNGYQIVQLIGGKSGANPKYFIEANWTLYPTSTS